MNADLSKRCVVATTSLPWTPRDGVEEKLLEHAGERRTSLVRMPPGSTLPVVGTGALDVLVLDGYLGVYGPGMFLHEPANARPLTSARGCTLFVKQRPAHRASRCALDIRGVAYEPGIAPGLAQAPLYVDPLGTVTMLRFAPSCVVGHHHHDLGEELFVLSGDLADEHGRYGAHDWVRQPSGSAHQVTSTAGALTFSFAHHL